jgi:hypothetical protein
VREGLPELRSVAARHPDLRVLYVLWDDLDSASAYAAKNSPIPGVVVVPDESARAKLEVVLGSPSFPSFVVIDAQGRVAALPDDDDLEAVIEASGVLSRGAAAR